MYKQRQSNNWSCLPTAFAIILDKPVQDVFDFLGHDGSEILWRDLPEPLCRRSFHIQEMYDYAIARDHMVMPIELMSGIQPANTCIPFILPGQRLHRVHGYLDNFDAVITGTFNGNRHAVAWVDGQYVCPSGNMVTDAEFETVYIIKSLR